MRVGDHPYPVVQLIAFSITKEKLHQRYDRVI